MSFSQFSTGATSEVNFIPEVFSKLLQAKFYKKSILPAISNTDYEGEISGQGDKVVIRTVPHVTINDYAGTITTQELTTSKVEMLIDKSKYHSFKLDDVLEEYEASEVAACLITMGFKIYKTVLSDVDYKDLEKHILKRNKIMTPFQERKLH